MGLDDGSCMSKRQLKLQVWMEWDATSCSSTLSQLLDNSSMNTGSHTTRAAATVDKMDFDLFEEKHLADSVREDVLRLRGEKSLDGLEVFGFTLDTQTGAVTPVQV